MTTPGEFANVQMERLVDEAVAIDADKITAFQASFPNDEDLMDYVAEASAKGAVDGLFPGLEADVIEYTNAIDGAAAIQKKWLQEFLESGTIDGGHAIGVRQFYVWEQDKDAFLAAKQGERDA